MSDKILVSLPISTQHRDSTQTMHRLGKTPASLTEKMSTWFWCDREMEVIWEQAKCSEPQVMKNIWEADVSRWRLENMSPAKKRK